jgi:hypothetical protein
MYRKKVMTAGLAVLAIVTAISLVTASSNSGLVTSAFAVKKGGGNSGTSSSGTSSYQLVKKVHLVQVVLAQVRKASSSNVLQQYLEVLQRLK